MNAWHELDNDRNRSDLEPIKRSSVFEYAVMYDFTEEQREDLLFYIPQMDREFLAWYVKARPKK